VLSSFILSEGSSLTGTQISILCYVLMQIVVGVIYSKSVSDSDDFIVAGRKIELKMASLTIFATWFGAEAVVGTAGAVYRDGLSGAAADPFGYTIALWLVGLFFAKALRARELLTLVDLFRREFGPRVERFVTLLIIPGPIIWGAAQLSAFGTVVSDVAQLSYQVGLGAAALTVILYTTLGGFQASAVTDMIQSFILMTGLVILFGSILYTSDVTLSDIPAERLSMHSEGLLMSLEEWSVPIFGTIVAVELASRLLACRSPEVARDASLIGGGLYLILGLIPVAIGLIAPLIMPESMQLSSGDSVVPALARVYMTLPDFIFPDLLYVLFIGALISAILSTVDSVMLSGASIISNNLLELIFPPKTSAARLLYIRGSVVGLGLTAYLLASTTQSVKELVEISSAFGSSGLFPVLCFGLFSSFGGPLAASAALLTGIASWVMLSALEVSAPYSLSVFASTLIYILIAARFEPTRIKET